MGTPFCSLGLVADLPEQNPKNSFNSVCAQAPFYFILDIIKGL
jgi:hypothetical protein